MLPRRPPRSMNEALSELEFCDEEIARKQKRIQVAQTAIDGETARAEQIRQWITEQEGKNNEAKTQT